MDESSAISHPVAGVPSGLTDPERYVLADLAIAEVMRKMDVPEDTARGLLAHAADQDRVTIEGSIYLVGLCIDDEPLVIVDRARLRGVVHPERN